MDIAAIISVVIGTFGLVHRFIIQPRRGWRRRRLTVYTNFLAVMDRAFCAAQELSSLRRGLRLWNGRQKLEQMRATGLDKRLIQMGYEMSESLEELRTVGTPKAVRAAEDLLAVVAVPMEQLEKLKGRVEIDLAQFRDNRLKLIQTVRRELHLRRLDPA